MRHRPVILAVALVLAACTSPDAPDAPAVAEAGARTATPNTDNPSTGAPQYSDPACRGIAKRLNGNTVSEADGMTSAYAVHWLRNKVEIDRRITLTGDEVARYKAVAETLLATDAYNGGPVYAATDTIHLLFPAAGGDVIRVHAKGHCYIIWGLVTREMLHRLLQSARDKDGGA